MTPEQTVAAQAAETTKPELTETERLAQERAAENEARMKKWMKKGTETPAEVAGEMQAGAETKTAEVVDDSEKLAEEAREAGADEIAQKTEGLGNDATAAKEVVDSGIKTESNQEVSTAEKEASAKALEGIKYNDTYNVESISGQEMDFTEMQIRVLRGEEPAIKDLSVIARDLGIQSADKWTHFQREFPKLSAEDRESLATELTDDVAKAREIIAKAEELKANSGNQNQEAQSVAQEQEAKEINSEKLESLKREVDEANKTVQEVGLEWSKLRDRFLELSEKGELKLNEILRYIPETPDELAAAEEKLSSIPQFKGIEVFKQALEEADKESDPAKSWAKLQGIEVPLLLRFGTLGKLRDFFVKDPLVKELQETEIKMIGYSGKYAEAKNNLWTKEKQLSDYTSSEIYG